MYVTPALPIALAALVCGAAGGFSGAAASAPALRTAVRAGAPGPTAAQRARIEKLYRDCDAIGHPASVPKRSYPLRYHGRHLGSDRFSYGANRNQALIFRWRNSSKLKFCAITVNYQDGSIGLPSATAKTATTGSWRDPVLAPTQDSARHITVFFKRR